MPTELLELLELDEELELTDRLRDRDLKATPQENPSGPGPPVRQIDRAHLRSSLHRVARGFVQQGGMRVLPLVLARGMSGTGGNGF